MSSTATQDSPTGSGAASLPTQAIGKHIGPLHEVPTDAANDPAASLAPNPLHEARRFLAAVVPWPENGEAYVNICATFQKPGYDKPAWDGRACRSLDEAIKA